MGPFAPSGVNPGEAGGAVSGRKQCRGRVFCRVIDKHNAETVNHFLSGDRSGSLSLCQECILHTRRRVWFYHEENKKLIFGTGDKWLEIAGCGVLHPNVLEAGRVDASKYRGLAFGCGLERLTSLKYGIPDLRGYFESTVNWRNSFGFYPFAK